MQKMFILNKNIMKNPKKFIIDLYNKLFREPKDGEDKKSRRLTQDSKTGKLDWSDGEKKFEDEDLKNIEIKPGFQLEDNKEEGTRMPIFEIPFSNMAHYYRKNRFMVEFPGVPEYYFSSYKYIGHDHDKTKKTLLTSGLRNIENDYSLFKVLLFVGGPVDMCDKMVELEKEPKIGDIKVHMLDATGVTLKTIVIPDCEVTEIKAFRDLDYGTCGDKSDDLLYGTIIVKHKQRKLI